MCLGAQAKFSAASIKLIIADQPVVAFEVAAFVVNQVLDELPFRSMMGSQPERLVDVAAAGLEGIEDYGIPDDEANLEYLFEFRLGRVGAEDAGERRHKLEERLGDLLGCGGFMGFRPCHG